jgi:hypothetical protein
MKETKFRYFYGVDGEIETYFHHDFTLGEIESGCIYDPLEDSPLLRDYSIVGRSQFTGFLDKNGKEIYEGDICLFIILKRNIDAENLKEYTVIIKWKNGCWGFIPTHPELHHPDDREWGPFYDSEDREMLDNNYFEVISNIYENEYESPNRQHDVKKTRV